MDSRHIYNIFTISAKIVRLLPSRLYCRFWILTKSCLAAHGLALCGVSPSVGNSYKKSPCPEEQYLLMAIFYYWISGMSRGKSIKTLEPVAPFCPWYFPQ